MYSLSECLSESNSEPLRWNIRWIFLRNYSGVRPVNYVCKKLHFRCSTGFEYHSGGSKPLLTFSKSQAADIFAN